jgi:oxygen-independent coproporphyrinogen-3 oxidase
VQRIDAGMLAGHRGHRFTPDDRLRARAIEMLMCDLRIELAALRDAFGAAAEALAPVHATACRRFAGFVRMSLDAVEILPHGRPLARMVASLYDGYTAVDATFSKAS